jgi:DNA-binding transcriptional ArsR family regulator
VSERWTFLTHHAHLMLMLQRDQSAKIEDLAQVLGVTPRYVVSILNDLTDGGYLTKERVGRRNHYSINREAELRHETSLHKSVGDLIDSLGVVGR